MLPTSHNKISRRSHHDEEDCVDASEERYESRLVLVVVRDEAEREGANKSPGVWRDGMVCQYCKYL